MIALTEEYKYLVDNWNGFEGIPPLKEEICF